LKQLRDDLWQTTPQSNGAINCSYLLLRSRGNVLFYNAMAQDDLSKMAELGGVAFHVLCHRHEVDQGPWKSVRDRFAPRLCSDLTEAAALGGTPDIDIAFGPGGGKLGDIEVLHTPGHTSGGISCVYRSVAGETYLFCADNFVPVHGHWLSTIVAEHGGDARTLARSVGLFRDLRPSLVLASTAVKDLIVDMPEDQWPKVVETNVRTLSG
jgi:hydroxyacylglutathione hydrolase